MQRTLRPCLLIVVVVLIALATISRPAPAADESLSPARNFVFTSITHVPAIPAGYHQLRIWVPLPFEDRSQGISHLKIESPVRYRIQREKEYGNRYVYVVVEAADTSAKAFDIRISFHAERFEDRVSLAPSIEPLGQPLVAPDRFLLPDRLVPIDGVIGELSDVETKNETLPVDKARRIYDYIIATMHYDHEGTEWGRGDAVWACNSKHGNCTDFHSLFIGMARAAGIPARFEIGFSLPTNAQAGVLTGYHCWAQFYASGIGWVPIDASEGWKNKEKRDYYFGAIDPNRVMFSLGRDIHLKPAQKGDPLNFFVYPYAELDGKPFTELKNEYTFRDDPKVVKPETKISTTD
jgi:transglutaminase-like putative cysteine protease